VFEATIFLAAGIVLVVAGSVLARAADEIAAATGLGRAWVGAILLASATSLPELTTDVAAVRLGAPDLAAGDLFGSSMANMLILALLDLLPPRRRVLQAAAFENALVASHAIALNALAAALLLAAPAFTVLGASPGAWALAAVYAAGVRALYRDAAQRAVTRDRAENVPRARLRAAAARFAIATIVVFVVAPAFARSAEQLAVVTGLGTTFVGTLLLGLATSMPELVSSLAALRLGAFDLAVGNLFGSNAFNMAIFLGLDLAMPGSSIFAAIDPSHALSGLFAVALMSLGLAAIVYRAERRFAMIEPGSAAMLLVYLLAVVTLYAEVVHR
jgi:cation:H+ antiporter